jgi:phenylacetic acid degradation protein
MPCYSINNIIPVIDPSAFVHPSAVLIGDVIVGAHCYIGPLASLRGDFGRLIIEKGANIQDCCVMHGFPGTDTVVRENGHIGHGAILHGCKIGQNALVGMNAVVMDGAVIGAESIVGAGAFVKAGFNCEPRSMLVGSPAKVIRTVTDEEIEWKTKGTAEYQHLAVRSIETMKEVQPLSVEEPNRPRISRDDIKPLYELKNKKSR